VPHTDTPPSSHAADLALLLTLSSLWGASYTFIRMGVETIPPLTFIAARTLIAATLLLLWMRSRNLHMPRDRQVWLRFGVQALLNSVVPFTLIAWAERSVGASLATILNSTSPVMVFVAAAFITRHEPMSLRKLVGVIAGFVSTCLVIGPSALDGLGGQLVPQLAIVAATACYAGAAIYGRSFKGLHAAAPATGSLLVGALVLTPASLLIDRPWALQPSARSLMALVALAAFSTALAFVIYFRLIQTLGAIGTTAQAYLRVPIGVAIGVAFLGESLPSSAWAGLACVVVGVAAMSMPTRAAQAGRA
jgi:drug/metabolite transporter (DMT)-like permease